MRNIISGGLPAALFVAPILLFSVSIVSCGGAGGDSAAAPSPAPSSKSSNAKTYSASLICIDKNCPTVTLASVPDTSHGGGPHIVYFEGNTVSGIPANTRFKIEVIVNDSTAY